MPKLHQCSKKQHIAVLAFPFGGHARPLLGLVWKLAAVMPEAHFSFFNTRVSNKQLFGEHDQDVVVSKNIKPYNVSDGVQPSHVFSSNPHEAPELFLKAAPENFKRSIDRAVLESNTRITAMIADSFLPIGEMIKEMRVPWALLWVAMPYPLYVYLNVDTIRHLHSSFNPNGNSKVPEIKPGAPNPNGNPKVPEIILGVPSPNGNPNVPEIISEAPNPNENPNVPKIIPGAPNPNVPEIIPGAPMIRAEDLPDGILVPGELGGTLIGDILDKLGATTARASAIVMNFYHELDLTPHTDFLRSQVPNLLCLGFLSLSIPSPPRQQLPNPNFELDCLSWLDNHEPGSVAYISFGTVVALPLDEQYALAEALEASKVPYLWSLGDKYKQTLPDGFLHRMNTIEKIVPWAPQSEVLGHPSVGVFVTHCGSNSVYESIASGVPMISRPFFGDHRVNARMVEEAWGIGLTVENGVMTRDNLVTNFEEVFVEETGKKMRERARALKELVKAAAGPDGKAAEDLKALVNILS